MKIFNEFKKDTDSTKWKQWTVTNFDDTCLTCLANNGKIYPIYADVSKDIPAHCRPKQDAFWWQI